VARDGTTIILITHHVEEVIPEIDHVVLLDRGRVAAEGPKADVLTVPTLSALFGAPLTVTQSRGYYQVWA
jgi:iron complex transport system ATP-binding protein